MLREMTDAVNAAPLESVLQIMRIRCREQQSSPHGQDALELADGAVNIRRIQVLEKFSGKNCVELAVPGWNCVCESINSLVITIRQFRQAAFYAIQSANA